MGRSPCCDKMGLKKGSWTPEEDTKLLSYVQQHGHGNWHALPSKAGLRRCGKSYRLRWANYLRPDIKRGKFSVQEDDTIIQLHALLGNRWSAIATHLPRRTDNEIKNYWNIHLKKRLTKMGIDPVTHKPTNQESSDGSARISHMAQWETARLEAEARSKLEFSITYNNNNYPYNLFNHDKQWACTNHAGNLVFNEYPSVVAALNSQNSIEDDTPSIGLSYTQDSIKVVGGCWGVLEDDDTVNNYWDNTLNAITRPVEARLYPGGDQVQI